MYIKFKFGPDYNNYYVDKIRSAKNVGNMHCDKG